jgi:hypothetical protein
MSDFCWGQNPFCFCKNIILFLKKKLLQNPNGFWSQQKSLDNIKPLHAFPNKFISIHPAGDGNKKKPNIFTCAGASSTRKHGAIKNGRANRAL